MSDHEEAGGEFDYVTRVDVNIAILREIAKLRFKERLPRIMEGVAKELIAAGVDFSHARLPETQFNQRLRLKGSRRG